MSGKPIGEADPNDFILAPDGTPDFGAITTEQAQSMRRQAGSIRLTVGEDKPGSRHGVDHIQREHGDEISPKFGTVENFVAYVAANYDEIRKGNKKGLLLVKRAAPNLVLVVELMPDNDGGADYYRVNSGWLSRTGTPKNSNLLWERGAFSSPASPGTAPGSRTSHLNGTGDGHPNTSGQSRLDTNLPPDAGNVKKWPELFQGPRGSSSPASSVTTLFKTAMPEDAR